MAYNKSYASKVQARMISHSFVDGQTSAYNESNSAKYDVGFDGSYGENPGWRNAIAAVSQAGTSMNVVATNRRRGYLSTGGARSLGGHVYKHTRYGTFLVSGNWDQYGPAVTAASEDSADNQALVKLVRALSRSQVSVQGGVVLGEVARTLRLLRSPLKSLYGGLRAYQRTAKKRARRAPKKRRKGILADTWLEYSFGWTPLIHDIDDASQYLARLTTNRQRQPFEVVTAVGVDEQGITLPNHLTWAAGAYYDVKSTLIKTSRKVVKYKAVVRVDDYGSYAHRDLGLGMQSWIPTVWELIPYSFLVDYFTNVGDVITAFSFPKSRVRWVMKWVIEERTCIDTPNVNAFKPPPNKGYHGNYLQSVRPAVLVEKVISRAPYSGSIVPSLAFETPGLSMKWLNLAALARNRL